MAEVNLEASDNVLSDEEPKLKYQRMENDVTDILVRDSVSCIAIHPKFVCIGTKWGYIYLLDHEGNKTTIATEDGSQKELHVHPIAVNQISVDTSGDHIATCSNDGKISLRGLYSPENNHSLILNRVIKSIALDPYFNKSGSSRFLVGGNRLTLYEKNFFSRNKCTVLSECEGYVQAVAWQDRFVAWASDTGFRVYDITARCSMGLIKWESNRTTKIEEYRCNLIWSADKTLMIGWVDTVRICIIRKRRDSELQTQAVSEYYVDPIYTFQIDYFICGLAPLDNQLVILGYPIELDSVTGKAQRPALNIFDYEASKFSEVSSDTLNIRGYEDYKCNDYHLTCVISENRFFIVSPKEIVIASQYDIDDKVTWLVTHEYYERAISLLEVAGGESSKHSVSSVGICYMDRLIEKGDFEEAAKIYSKVCTLDRSLWEKEIRKFASTKKLRAICPYIPTSLNEKLAKRVYDMIIYEHIKCDAQGLLKIIKEWNPLLYNVSTMIKSVIEQLLLTEADKSYYLETLGILYCHQKKYDKALTMYLKLQHPDVFGFIIKHNLHIFIHDKILLLMKLDCDKAITMLLDKSMVPVEVVEEQLKSNDFYLYKYLDALSKVDSGGVYHQRLVKLYADFSRENLLPFLKSSNCYRIEEALEICKARNFHPETIYLLGRIGNTKDALNIIIETLKDINQAILFCQEYDDKDLWLDLISYSLDKPEYVTLLLKRIGNFVDPTALVRGIKSDSEIHDLKDSLGKMMRDFNLQLSVQGACKAITFRNYFDLHEKLINSHHKGLSITDEYLCSSCHGKIIKDLAHSTDMVIYNCHHIFHVECSPIVNPSHAICAVCNPVNIDD